MIAVDVPMGMRLYDYQTTIRSRISLSGTGVHSGKPVVIHLNPADADTGIVFQKVDGDHVSRDIRAVVSEVGAVELCTVLGDPAGDHVATVEHLMAALYGLGIDNLLVEVEGNEVPVLDGSSGPFVEAIDQVGIERQSVKRRYLRILKPVRIEAGASWAEFVPYSGTRFEVEIDFDSPAIGRQAFISELEADAFRKGVARARTFGFIKDVERLWAAGFALGSSLENSVVIDDDHRVVNVEGLRYRDEFVRHKMLDAMGDIALAGARFIGCFRSFRGGHKLNAAVLKRLLSDRSAFEVVESQRKVRGRAAELVAVSAPAYAPWMV